jgi:hypothetical protein
MVDRAITGVIYLAGPYLLVVTRRTHVGNLLGHDIWEVAETDCIRIAHSTRHLSQEQVGWLCGGSLTAA